MKPRARAAFTLIELMVVVGIIVILLGAIVGIGTAVIGGAKVSDTRALLQTLELAVKQFEEDGPLKRNRDYVQRFGDYPPDELEAFVNSYTPVGSVALLVSPRSAPLTNSPTTGGTQLNLANVQHGDVKAMALAIKLYSPAGAQILERIDSRFRKLPVNASGNPNEFLGRLDAGGTVNEPLEYFVDAWGVPIDYYATADDSSNVRATADVGFVRRDASAAFVRMNNGAPLFVSYGPNGEDQFADDTITAEGESDLVADFHDDSSDGQVDHNLNQDNVYADQAIAERLLKGS